MVERGDLVDLVIPFASFDLVYLGVGDPISLFSLRKGDAGEGVPEPDLFELHELVEVSYALEVVLPRYLNKLWS